MIKPVWALAGIAVLGTAGVVGALVVESSGGEEEVVQQVETATASTTASADATLEPTHTPSATEVPPTPAPIPGPGETPWRWGNVTITIPDVPDLFVDTESTPTGGPGIRVTKYTSTGSDTFSTLLIDADNGSIVISEIRDEDRALIGGILATLTVSQQDPAALPWPYSSDFPPSDEREVYAGFSFLRPLPETGLHLVGGIGDPGGEYIGLRNSRSAVVVNRDPTTGGLAVEFPWMAEEDRAALERWVSAIRICGSEIEC